VFKTAKPWLTYCLGDGLDKVEAPKNYSPKKYSTAIVLFLIFGGIAGHRFYVGERLAGLRLIFVVVLIQFTIIFLSLLGVLDKISQNYFEWLLLLITVGIAIFEFRSIKPGVEKRNAKIAMLKNNRDKYG